MNERSTDNDLLAVLNGSYMHARFPDRPTPATCNFNCTHVTAVDINFGRPITITMILAVISEERPEKPSSRINIFLQSLRLYGLYSVCIAKVSAVRRSSPNMHVQAGLEKRASA